MPRFLKIVPILRNKSVWFETKFPSPFVVRSESYERLESMNEGNFSSPRTDFNCKFFSRIGILLLVVSLNFFQACHAIAIGDGRDPVLSASLGGIKNVTIKSLTQSLRGNDIAQFDGVVEVFVDNKLHIWADHVTVDKRRQEIEAWVDQSGAVLFEDDRDTVVTADRIKLNFKERKGRAQCVTIRIARGYITASDAEQAPDQSWMMNDLVYTPCDASDKHWHLTAQHASLHPSGVLKASGIFFKIGSIPFFWLPRLSVASKGQSKSGFLMPRFSYDYDTGLGIKQEFYGYFTPHLDTTIGIDWRDRRGIDFSDEFRWARSASDVTFIKAHWAFLKNVFTQKGDRIVVSSAHRNWVHGTTTRSWKCPTLGNISNLVRMDFGTDKRITYIFSNNTDDVDDMFSNSCIMRAVQPRSMYEIRINSDETSRKQFLPLSAKERELQLQALAQAQALREESWLTRADKPVSTTTQKERVTKVGVVELPHLSGASTFYALGGGVNYRHDFFVDQIFYRQQENEYYFADRYMIDNETVVPFDKAQLLRLLYQGNLTKRVRAMGNTLSLHIRPQLQVRSKTLHDAPCQHNVLEQRHFGNGACRALVTHDVIWGLPTLAWDDGKRDVLGELCPSLEWSYAPKFYQQHWYDMDRYDRMYPKNECAARCDSRWQIGDNAIDLSVKQAYDFYARDDWFELRRPTSKTHVVPLSTQASFDTGTFFAVLDHEHDWGSGKLLQIGATVGYNAGQTNGWISYLYQSSAARQERQLLSTVPHFFLVNYSLALGRHATLSYDGQFYAEQGDRFLAFKPLIHKMKLDYQGHCWGFYVGFEEKKYRDCGTPKTEHYLVFGLRLDTLGSFAKKIKPPSVEHEKEPVLQQPA